MSSPSVKPAFVAAALGAVALLIGVGVIALGGTAALVAALTAGSPIGPEVPEGAPIVVMDDPDVVEPPAPAAEGGGGGSVFGGLGGAAGAAGGQDTAELVADAGDSGGRRPAKAGKAGKAKAGKAKAGKAKSGKAKAGKGGKGKGKGGKARASEAPAPAPAPAPTKKECKPDSPYVEQTGERSWNVKESFVEKNSKDLDSAEKLANVGWARDGGGDIIGFKIRSLPCNSPLREAGFVKGDIIRSVNGKEIKSVSSAMRVGLEVRKAGNMKVRLTRKGASREHFYKMVK
ncbi:MAG: hypothetical protein RL071_2893 [Pseudomonadota bacterium]|jgi:hypothetical protein